jgi:hypothetical protein
MEQVNRKCRNNASKFNECFKGGILYWVSKILFLLVYVWYPIRYVRITVIHLDFSKAIKCNLCKIMVGHYDSDTFTLIPNIRLFRNVMSW